MRWKSREMANRYQAKRLRQINSHAPSLSFSLPSDWVGFPRDDERLTWGVTDRRGAQPGPIYPFGPFPFSVTRVEPRGREGSPWDIRERDPLNLTIMERFVDPAPHVCVGGVVGQTERHKGATSLSLSLSSALGVSFHFLGGDHFSLSLSRVSATTWGLPKLERTRVCALNASPSSFSKARFHIEDTVDERQ